MNIRMMQRLVLLPALALICTMVESAQPIAAKFVSTSPVSKAIFYSIRPDLRRCISPLCGGYFISAVNRRGTRCADGVRRKECYVAEIQWDEIGLPDDPEAALVLGNQRKEDFRGFGSLGILVPKAAWRAAGSGSTLHGTSDQFAGRWFGLRHTGVVCVAAPCYNIKERYLNRHRRQVISGVDLSEVDADPDDVTAAMNLLRKDELLAVGKNELIPNEGPAGDGVTMVASDFFLPVKARRDDALYCEVDTDCTVSVYHTRVRSKDECYCPLCPQPISAVAANKNEASWLRYCRDFGFSVRDDRSATLICPRVLCKQPLPVRCINNQCVELDKAPRPFDLLPR